MELVRQGVQQALHPRKSKGGPQDPDGDEDINIIIQDPETAWRRLALRVFCVLRAAHWQSVVAELVAIPPPGRLRVRLQDPVNIITRAQLYARQRLPDSTSAKVIVADSRECIHEEIATRGGNKSYWYACKACPARWPRMSQQERVEDLFPDGTAASSSRRPKNGRRT